MPNMPKHSEHGKICTIKLYIFITIVVKRICTSLSMFFYVAKKKIIQMHVLTSPGN